MASAQHWLLATVIRSQAIELLRNLKTKTMKTGIELIAIERQEQIKKHQIGVKNDVNLNRHQQLPDAAMILLEEEVHELTKAPYKWESKRWEKMIKKPIKDRLVIAGALIAAEIDRIQFVETNQQKKG